MFLNTLKDLIMYVLNDIFYEFRLAIPHSKYIQQLYVVLFVVWIV